MFFPSGDPDGLKIVKKDNWSGRLLAFRRDQLDDAMARDELRSVGVYVLRGPEGDPNDIDGVRIYVGQSSTLATRLEDHARNKEFWTDAVVAIRAGDSLDRADALYLEARLVELARGGGWCFLDNGQMPNPMDMLEPDKEASAEGYLEEVVPCLSALGFPEFEEPVAPPTDSLDSAASRSYVDAAPRTLRTTRAGIEIEARGRRLADRSFEILKGSEALASEVPSLAHRAKRAYRQSRLDILESKDVEREGGKFRFTRNVIVSSPSLAEVIVAGRPGSGLANWREGGVFEILNALDDETFK